MGACLVLLALPFMGMTALADGPQTGGVGDELTDDTTVTADIQASIITTITAAHDFGSIPAGTATENLAAIAANVRSNVVYSMDVHALTNMVKGADSIPIANLDIKGGDLVAYTDMTLTARGIHILVAEAIPGSDAGTDYNFDLKLTPPSNTPAGADYTTTLRFTTFQ
jgi:hypothetical protein